MKTIYQILSALSFVACMGSCSDFLEGKSQDQILVKTTKDYGELLYGSGYPQSNALGIVEQMTDDADWRMLQSVENKQNYSVNEAFMTAYCWQPDLYEYGTKVPFTSTEYYLFYDKIKGCNAVLDGIDEAIGTQYEHDRVKAEALALRAYHYFQLVNLYGQPYNKDKQAPGVPLKLTAAIQETGLARNTVEEVYRQVEDDLLASIDLLKPYAVTEKDYRINLPAIYTLLSRVYLYMEEWQKVADHATEALKINGTLCDLTTVESTFVANSYDSPEVYWNFGGSLFEQNKQPSDELIESFEEGDVRHDLSNGLYLRSRLENDPNAPNVYPRPQVYLGSYSTPKCQNVIGNESGDQQVLPGLSIRASEAYLNRAEAYAKLGHNSEALDDLNRVRRHRIKGYQELTEADVPDMLEAVRAERRREFCFEGFRWFDLRRYGCPRIVHRFQVSGPVMYYILPQGDPMYTLPLPSTVIELNPLLEQNPSAYVAYRSAVSSEM